jgi:hypothetical protein
MNKKSPLNFGMPMMGQNPFMQYQTQNPVLNNAMMFGNQGNVALQGMMAQRMAAEQAANPQSQVAASSSYQDPNNVSSVGFNNAPASTVSSVPITTGGMSEQTQGVAEGIFGETLGRQRIMNANRTVQPQGLISF